MSTKRYPKADRSIQGRTCRAYLLTKLDRYADSSLKAGQRRILLFVDEESRLVRAAHESRDGDEWRTESLSDWTYDEPINEALFQPNFGDDVKIVDADEAFDAFADPATAVHCEERDGLIYAIHHVERFENGGVLVVSSVRGTAETLKEFPLKKSLFRVDGPATNYNASPQGSGFFRLDLASASHQGIDVRWWVLIPRGTPPNHFEVSPGRIKLNVGVTPSGEYAKARHRDEKGIINHMRWDVELDLPRPGQAANAQRDCRSSPHRSRRSDFSSDQTAHIGDHRVHKSSDVDDINSAEYAKAIANKIRSWQTNDIEFQLEGLPDPKTQKRSIPGGAGRKAMGLRYEPLVNDATLQRVAKHRLLTVLYLRGTRITDDGLIHLSGLTKLEKLDLAETGITDAGLVHLRGLSTLKKLYLRKRALRKMASEISNKHCPASRFNGKTTSRDG